MYRKLKASVKKIVGPVLRRSAARHFPKTDAIRIAPGFTMGKYVHIRMQGSDMRIDIQPNVTFREFCSIAMEGKAELVIQRNVFFNNYCSVNCLEKIVIGENTLFGEGVKLYDHNHLYETAPVFKVHTDLFTTAPITIGSNCWIASNVTILKGVTIGDNVIIGANNLIYQSIPSNTLIKAKTDLTMTQL